jgi:hypothetical protein
MVHVEAVIPYGQGELVNLIHRLGIVELEVSEYLKVLGIGNMWVVYCAIASISGWLKRKGLSLTYKCVSSLKWLFPYLWDFK